MNVGNCILSMIPVREKPSDKSQMINQLIFGDLVRIKDRIKPWLLIESLDDEYCGWVDEKQINPLEEETFEQYRMSPNIFLNQPTAIAQVAGIPMHLTMGSKLIEWDGIKMKINGDRYSFSSPPSIISGKKTTNELILIAHSFLGSPYLWGGRSIFGIDCSGFTQMVFKMAGYQLPRDSSKQAAYGKSIDFIHEAESGDLAFFEDEEGQIVHVGILLNKESIIHASGEVRIDTIDHEGIFNESRQQYTHKLRIIKRIIND